MQVGGSQEGQLRNAVYFFVHGIYGIREMAIVHLHKHTI